MADNIPIMVEKDEYVVNNNATSNPLVRKLLDLINFDMFPKSPDRKSIMGDHLRQGYSHGGPADDEEHTITYGGYDVEYPELEDLFEEFQFQPEDKYRGRFKEYDIGRETPWREDYATKVGALQQGARSGLGTATEKAMSLGRGFAGFGEREYGMGQTRKSMLGKYLTGKEQAHSTMFKGIRGEREQYLGDMAAQMRHLESIEGTKPLSADSGAGVGCEDACNDALQSCMSQTDQSNWGMCENIHSNCMSNCGYGDTTDV